MRKTRLSIKRLVSLVEKRAVARAKDLYCFGVHPHDLSKAAREGLLVKIGRGLYTRKGFPTDFEHQIVLACLRVPSGIVCLQSALAWHGILPRDSGQVWMAIHRKAKKPVVDGVKLRFVRFSGHALTQGVVNAKIESVPVRIYSAAKTVADCLKYRRKIGVRLIEKIVDESIAGKKCSEQRLRHFAKICRVYKLVHAAYSVADPSVRVNRRRLKPGFALVEIENHRLAEFLGKLGYPGFAHLPTPDSDKHPFRILLTALAQKNLDPRVAEALPWVALQYAKPHPWLVENSRRFNLQNHLGFVVSLARRVAEIRGDGLRSTELTQLENLLEESRLAKEGFFYRAPRTENEKEWLRKNRTEDAAHWNMLSDMRPEQLPYPEW